jgi:acyl-coenzyme A synthetase/AMP-(fatty) acid ligase
MTNVATRLIDQHVQASRGEKRAFEFSGKPYSYHDVAALANRAGNMLKSLGVPAGARVLMVLPESPAYVATLIGAMKIGAVPVVAGAASAHLKACSPVIAVIHAKFFPDVNIALPADKVVVVGDAPAGHPSFVELMRSQSSSLAAEPVSAESPALVVANGKLLTLSHRQLEAALASGNPDPLGRAAALLRAFANAEIALLS